MNIKKKFNSISLKPVTTEKAVMLIESQNVLTFQTGKNATKEQIKKEIEDLFDVKIEKVRTLIRGNKKHAYVKLNKKNPAIDVATKLGLI
ncbi:MAG: 50S ribosomal protein L23 [Nanoarchaeota archaeon]|nr:50S ribosomal protein L23 [Nanoarchaeota archaeon]